MDRARRIGALVALASALAPSLARADFGRHCEPRALSAAERAKAERVFSAFRAALPAAPAGWTVLDKDTEQVSGVACDIAGKTGAPGGKLLPTPINIFVHRKYLRTEAPPSAAAQAVPVPLEPAAAAGADPARMEELKAQLSELERSRKEAVVAYQQARRAGDSAAQGAARRREREIYLAMRPVEDELRRLKEAESAARAEQSKARHAAALAHDRAAQERRTDASVSIAANLKSVQNVGAEALDAGGADVAMRESDGFALLLGTWTVSRGWGAVGTIDEAAPPELIQTIAVQIGGSPAAAEALRSTVDLARLRGVVGR